MNGKPSSGSSPPIALIEVLPGHLLSVASALAGCGPAFAAMFLEALADGGVKNGPHVRLLIASLLR